MDETRLSRFLAGEASETEAAAVRAWLAESEANRRELDRLRRIWEAAATPPPRPVDVDAAWQRLRGQMRPATAAAPTPKGGVFHVEKVEKKAPFGGWGAWPVWRVAASVAVLLGLGWLGYRLAFPPTVPVPPVEVASGTTPREVTLPDGSRVTLNRASRLRYAAGFDGETRLVALTGEAFFDVKRNPEKPFVIEARGTEVRVLGTSFNVNATTPDVAVTVATGTVRFSGKNTQNQRAQVVLTKDEAATFRTEADTILKANRANPNALAYKTRVLLFESTPLSEVVEALNHTYQANITLARPLRNCPLTVAFENETLDTILGVLADTYRLQIVRGADGRIAIEGDGCGQ